MTTKDNPLRLRRMKARLSQTELARRAGLHRSSLVFIEEGQTRNPSDETLGKLSQHLAVSAEVLRAELDEWLSRQAPIWSHKQAAILKQSGDQIRQVYPSFTAWRKDLGLATHRLARVMGVARSTVLEYENGQRVGGMPESMQSGLLELGLPVDAMLALMELPPHD